MRMTSQELSDAAARCRASAAQEFATSDMLKAAEYLRAAETFQHAYEKSSALEGLSNDR